MQHEFLFILKALPPLQPRTPNGIWRQRSFNQLFINDPAWTWLPHNTHMDRNIFQNGLVSLQISVVNLAWFRLHEQTTSSSTGETGTCRQAPVHLPMCQQKSGLTRRSFLDSHMHASSRTGHMLRRWKNNKRASFITDLLNHHGYSAKISPAT